MKSRKEYEPQSRRLSQKENGLDRRVFLRRGAAALVGLGLGAAGLSLLGCESNSDEATGERFTAPTLSGSGGGPVREVRLVASPGEVEAGMARIFQYI